MHVKRTQMMFEFEVDGALSGWEHDFFHAYFTRNLVDLGDILRRGEVDNFQPVKTEVPDEQASSRSPGRCGFYVCAILKYGPP